MKLTLSLLLLAAGGLIWVLATRGAPTFVPPAEAQTTYAPAPTVLVHGPAAGQVERDFDVEGMCCKGCTGKLHARLVALPGVHEAAVDFDSGTASSSMSASWGRPRAELHRSESTIRGNRCW